MKDQIRMDEKFSMIPTKNTVLNLYFQKGWKRMTRLGIKDKALNENNNPEHSSNLLICRFFHLTMELL